MPLSEKSDTMQPIPTDTDFLVGVEEPRSGHAGGDRPHRLDDNTLITLQIEAAFDGLTRQEVHLLDREGDIFRHQFAAQTRALSDESIDAFAQDNHIGKGRSAMAVRLHTDHFSRSVAQQFGDRRLIKNGSAGVAHLTAEPFVELCADDGIAVRPFFVEIVRAVMHSDIGRVVEHPHALFDDVTLQRCVFAKFGNDLFQRVRVQNRALDVFRAGIFAPFELKHFVAGFRQGIGGRVARWARAHHDRVKTFLVHCRLLSPRAG